MSNASFFKSVGGVPLFRSSHDGTGGAYNFGLVGSGQDLAQSYKEVARIEGPSFHAQAPHAAGRWDGKTNVSNWIATQKVLGGKFLEAQNQKIGSCGGAATSGGANVVQCSAIASGAKEGEFKRVSRAWCYVGARTLSGIRGQGEGVIPPSPVEWVRKYGSVNLDETHERYDSDELAKQWDRRGLPDDMTRLAADNIFEELVPVRTFQEACDVITSGGVVMVASDRGFEMTRDADGFCGPEGEWMHYMYFASIRVTSRGRRGLGCGQSWGDNTPSGPMLDGCPGYVFGVDEDVVDYMLGQGTSTGVTGIKGWGGTDYEPWIF